MSFRSVSAPPKCLQGRLATRCSVLRSSRIFSYQSRLNTTQSVISEGNQSRDTTDATERAISSLLRDHNTSKSQLRTTFKRRRRSTEDQLSPRSNTSSRDARFNTPTKHTSTPRVGGTLEIPAFLSDQFYPSKRDNDQVAEREGRPRARNTKSQSVAERYKEWEELNDRFLEIRRTRPDQTADVFSEQRLLTKEFLGDTSSGEASALEFRRKWLGLKREKQSKLLPSLLIGSLVESASQSLFVLSNIWFYTHTFRIRMTCLRHISIMYWKELEQNPKMKHDYETMIASLRSSDTWPKDKLPTVLLQNLLFWSSPEQCETIIQDFSDRYPDADPSSAVAIIDHYLRTANPEPAFEYLKRLPADSLRQPDEVITALRDRLLKLDIVAKGESGTNFKYLPQLLALGIPTDEALHNTVIESAISNELPDVAWDLYQYLESSNFRSNARSHLVLLRDAFQRGDMQRVNTIMTAMHNREDLISDQYLMAYSMNIVRNISCYETQLEPHEALAHIMALYDRAYDRSPLVRLGVVQPLGHDTPVVDPSPTLLAFTLWTWTLIQRRESDVLRLWEWVKYFIANEDQAVIEAAKYDIIFNGLMLFHGRKPHGLVRALEVMQYILSHKPCLPTSRSWSILLCCFLKHGQTEQAQKVLNMMQSKGFSVQYISEKYSSYVPLGYDLQSLMQKSEESLDEKAMPEGLEEMLKSSKMLQEVASP